ncbi:uncharacterized protein LOC114757564 [Neltuma alba]|uniref:uncharacterized protein LOC114757564 n=1 Tax=Neltuma alba TaxID=207710 RepID=UPI0010A59E25|nr:uncharacterized protein LOC114757564 [Prosopis alba]
MEGLDKARFARLAVKLDLTKPLVSKLRLDGITQYVEYEGLPTICYQCGRYGHLEATCPLKLQASNPETSVHAEQEISPKNSAVNVQTSPIAVEGQARAVQARESNMFGAWMKAPTRNWRSRNPCRSTDNNSMPGDSGRNRFNILATPEMSEEQEEGNNRTESPDVRMSVSSAGQVNRNTRKDPPRRQRFLEDRSKQKD